MFFRIKIYLGWFLLLACAACQGVTSNSLPTPTVELTSIVEQTPEVTAPAQGHWEQMEADGVMLGIQIPPGWEMQETEEGILLAEAFASMESGTRLEGMQIHLFVHRLDEFVIPDAEEANVAWAVLEQIIAQPRYIGDAKVSQPHGFDWDGHDAAYYLLNNGDGNVSMLVAVVVPKPERLVVCNISSPASQSQDIRRRLPEILSSLTVNGSAIDISALHRLPDPLEFPESDSAEITPKP